jgi:uncharacterized LabA/DUF88 family protein
MPDRTFVYIDGESHYVRSEDLWRTVHGKEADLQQLRHLGQTDDKMVLVLPKAKVFWTRKLNPGVNRATYFTSAVGGDAELHPIMVTLKTFDLEPFILPERSALYRRRESILRDSQVIEKAKGVDISLAVRMLEDAYHQAFDECHLYTSDVDFLPVIEAVRALGKRVVVHGFRNGLGQHSKLLTVPDQFIDLEDILRNDCVLCQSE